MPYWPRDSYRGSEIGHALPADAHRVWRVDVRGARELTAKSECVSGRIHFLKPFADTVNIRSCRVLQRVLQARPL